MKWFECTKEYIDAIIDFKPNDRLDSIAGIKNCCLAIAFVLGGWDTLIKNQEWLSRLSEEDTKKLFEEWRILALQVLRHDSVWRIKMGSEPNKNPDYVA